MRLTAELTEPQCELKVCGKWTDNCCISTKIANDEFLPQLVSQQPLMVRAISLCNVIYDLVSIVLQRHLLAAFDSCHRVHASCGLWPLPHLPQQWEKEREGKWERKQAKKHSFPWESGFFLTPILLSFCYRMCTTKLNYKRRKCALNYTHTDTHRSYFFPHISRQHYFCPYK